LLTGSSPLSTQSGVAACGDCGSNGSDTSRPSQVTGGERTDPPRPAFNPPPGRAGPAGWPSPRG
jgi:hypothetical protein